MRRDELFSSEFSLRLAFIPQFVSGLFQGQSEPSNKTSGNRSNQVGDVVIKEFSGLTDYMSWQNHQEPNNEKGRSDSKPDDEKQ
jgi:hypothetical protein